MTKIWRATIRTPPYLGGRELHVVHVSRAAVAAGDDVTLLYGFGDPDVPGATIRHVPTPSLRLPAALHATCFALQVAVRCLLTPRSLRPAYLHMHGDAYESAVMALLSRVVRLPVLVTLHGRPGSGIGARAAWKVARLGRLRIITVSSAVGAEAAALVGARQVVATHSSGVRDPFFEHRFAGPAVGIVANGIVSPRRDFTTVIDAVAMLPEPRPPVRIIGSGPDVELLLAHAAKVGVELHIAAETDPDAIASVLANHVYVQAFNTVGDGFPTALLEALAVRTPCAVANFPGSEDRPLPPGSLFDTAAELAQILPRLLTQADPSPEVEVPRWTDVNQLVNEVASSR